jgi:hypothetical protein
VRIRQRRSTLRRTHGFAPNRLTQNDFDHFVQDWLGGGWWPQNAVLPAPQVVATVQCGPMAGRDIIQQQLFCAD